MKPSSISIFLLILFLVGRHFKIFSNSRHFFDRNFNCNFDRNFDRNFDVNFDCSLDRNFDRNFDHNFYRHFDCNVCRNFYRYFAMGLDAKQDDHKKGLCNPRSLITISVRLDSLDASFLLKGQVAFEFSNVTKWQILFDTLQSA